LGAKPADFGASSSNFHFCGPHSEHIYGVALTSLPIFKIWMNNLTNIGFQQVKLDCIYMINFVALETNTISGINGTQISILLLIHT
jgi:hypothetical protein